jgi:UDP-glucose 4-epimerase
MKILVTGGLGYVGGRLAEYLSSLTNYQVDISCHSEKSWSFPWLKNSNIVKLDLPGKIGDLVGLCRGYDAIVHLAALNDKNCKENPEAAFSVNCQGVFNLLEAAKQAKVKRFIYLSTAHVCGSPLDGNISETRLTKAFHPYAWSHKIAEDLVLAAHGNNEIEGVVLRMSNSLGAPIHPDVDCWRLLLNDLAKQVVSKNQMLLRTSGEQYRDFIAMEDVVRGIRHILELPGDKLCDGLFNLGGEYSVPLLEIINLLADCAEEVLQKRPKVILGPKIGDMKELIYDITKIKKTGFLLKNSIKEELCRLLLFCKEHESE